MSLIILLVSLLLASSCYAHDHSRPDLDGWFSALKSGKGYCCSDMDGTALLDTDWKSDGEGHFKVRIEDEWWDVPDDAVIKEANRSGRTIVWPNVIRGINNKIIKVEIRCFITGAMI